MLFLEGTVPRKPFWFSADYSVWLRSSCLFVLSRFKGKQANLDVFYLMGSDHTKKHVWKYSLKKETKNKW